MTDSLSAMKYHVYDKKTLPMADLLKAMKDESQIERLEGLLKRVAELEGDNG